MKFSEYFIPTLKETPKDAEARSHILMLRSGMIRKLSSGYYSYLPLGLRVLRKVEEIIREEMNRAGAIELFMPAVHPSELWKKTGRYEVLGDILMKVKKGDREYVLGPTHEEIITELATSYLKSYKDLPRILYQIQTKFRHEARPRFGVIRSREFLMKDAYSFDRDEKDLDENYGKMLEAYKRIFTRCGLDFVIVQADSGAMGGSSSHEFMVLVDFGEDRVIISESSGEAWSAEVAECRAAPADKKETPAKQENVKTPGLKTIEEVSGFLKVSPKKLIKAILYETPEETIMVLVRGDHEICEAKLAKALKGASFQLASEAAIEKATGAPVGFSGPVGLNGKIRILADHAVKAIQNVVVGANQKDEHIINVNPERDFKADEFSDLRYIQDGDPCPDGSETARIRTALEIGHVFKLGKKYTEAFDGKYLDSGGKEQTMLMGCYGIGVNRILASCIEQNCGEKGMVWPRSIAPFDVHLITANQSSGAVCGAADQLYRELTDSGVEVLYDDRDERMGPKLNDAELIGVPVHVIIGDRGLKEGNVEVRDRLTAKVQNVPLAAAKDRIGEILHG